MRRALVLVAALVLAGCYTAPDPMVAQEQQQRDAAARAQAAWRDQQAAQAAQQRAEAERDAKTERMCAASTDPNVQLACAQWDLERRRLAWQQQQAQRDAQASADADFQQQAQETRDRERERRQRIADAIQAGAAAYQRAMPHTCSSSINGSSISTTCY